MGRENEEGESITPLFTFALSEMNPLLVYSIFLPRIQGSSVRDISYMVYVLLYVLYMYRVLLRLYWAGDNLGAWNEFCYESCPWCRFDHSTCWLVVQRATTVPWMPPLSCIVKTLSDNTASFVTTHDTAWILLRIMPLMQVRSFDLLACSSASYHCTMDAPFIVYCKNVVGQYCFFRDNSWYSIMQCGSSARLSC